VQRVDADRCGRTQERHPNRRVGHSRLR
jgi:hypothetical protein